MTNPIHPNIPLENLNSMSNNFEDFDSSKSLFPNSRAASQKNNNYNLIQNSQFYSPQQVIFNSKFLNYQFY